MNSVYPFSRSNHAGEAKSFGLTGHRYNRETLEIEFKGKSIADVLEMAVDEAAEFFKAVPAVRDKMETLQRVGLGYIKVGQQATTLSGGAKRQLMAALR